MGEQGVTKKQYMVILIKLKEALMAVFGNKSLDKYFEVRS